MFEKKINSVAILDFISCNSMDFQLCIPDSSNNIINFINPLIDIIYNRVDSYKSFNTIMLSFDSILLFLITIGFNSSFSIFKDFLVSKNYKIGGGGGISWF